MKLGINIHRSGTFLFKVSNNNNAITKALVQKNMLGWLFHTPNIGDYIELLPVERYVVTPSNADKDEELIEISQEQALSLYKSLRLSDELPVQKINK